MKTNLFRIVFLFFGLVSLYACDNDHDKFSENDLSKFDKLVGNWASLHDEGSLYEKWQKDSNNVYHGESFMLSGSDTVYKTNFVINYVDGHIVKHVNNISKRRVYSIDYKLIKITDGVFVFQNDSVSFPKTVDYKFTDNEGFIIDLDGEMAGEPMHEEFVFVADLN